ncbi:MAG: hypothetical protein AB1649_34565 [Chloroflexota bacterium]
MSIKRSPERQLHAEPPVEDDPERLLSTVLMKAIDDFSTCKPIAEKLRAYAEDEQVSTIIAYWKQALVEHLEETVQLATDNLLADLDRLQQGGTGPAAPETRTPSVSGPAPRSDVNNRVG